MSKLLIFLILIISFSCNSSPTLLKIHGKSMGTTYNISYFASTEDQNKKNVQAKVRTVLEKVNNQMSTYLKESEISKFNRLKANTWMKISPWFMEVLKYSLELAEVSNGAFDPTIGPMVNLWGFGPNPTRRIPSKKLIKETLQVVGYKLLKVNPKESSIKKSKDKMFLDLSATAKGFAVDKISELLKELKVSNFLVEIGGEIKVFGKNQSRNWKLAIETPELQNIKGRIHKVLNLHNEAMATSGNYRNFFTVNSKTYGHTLNYKTGKPVENSTLSASVIHPKSCMKADGLATLLMSMDAKAAYDFSNKHLIESYIIYKKESFEAFSIYTSLNKKRLSYKLKTNLN